MTEENWVITNKEQVKIPSNVVGYFFNLLISISNFLPDTLIVITTGVEIGAGTD